MGIARYVGQRLVALLVVLTAVSFLVFVLQDLSPGGPELSILGISGQADPEAVAAVRAKYHLDEPLLVRYGYWLGDAVRLDFGRSTNTGEPVMTVVGARAPDSLRLALSAFAVVLLVGIPCGLLAAFRRGRLADRAITTTAIVFASAPPFAVAIVLIYLLGVRFPVLPPFGTGEGLLDTARHLVLPALALSTGGLALIVRQMRASALDVRSQDYVTFARSRGVSRSRILVRYLLRNTLVPVVTAGGLLLAGMVSGVVFVESVFGLPGLGSLLIDSITSKDLPVVQGLTLLTASVVVLGSLLVDLAALALDPRARMTGADQ